MFVKRWGSIISELQELPIEAHYPKDLFIPPDALEILLESFSGPLDLLLYLIRRDQIDIMDIPIVSITEQYLQYIELMEEQRMELAVDYLVMAAMLAEIKSRLLLPVMTTENHSDEEDPRMELIKRLQVYEQFKQAAMLIEQLPRRDRDIFRAQVPVINLPDMPILTEVTLHDLVQGYRRISERQTQVIRHQIHREITSVQERMVYVVQRLQEENVIEFHDILQAEEGRLGIVVSFLAILELAKQAMLIILQADVFMPIYLQHGSSCK